MFLKTKKIRKGAVVLHYVPLVTLPSSCSQTFPKTTTRNALMRFFLIIPYLKYKIWRFKSAIVSVPVEYITVKKKY